MKQILLATAGAAALAIATVAAQAPQPAAVSTIPVQGSVSLITAGGVNVTVQTGKNGVVLVDTPPPALVPEVLSQIRTLAPRLGDVGHRTGWMPGRRSRSPCPEARQIPPSLCLGAWGDSWFVAAAAAGH